MLKIAVIMTIPVFLAACSSQSSERLSSVDWDNMDFASVHCDGNEDSEACGAGKNRVNIMVTSKGKK